MIFYGKLHKMFAEIPIVITNKATGGIMGGILEEIVNFRRIPGRFSA